MCGGVVEWLAYRTSNVWIACSNQVRGKPLFEKENLHSMLSTGWFQERIIECVYVSL